MKLPVVDLAVLLTYLAGITGFGIWFARRTRSADRFMAADRALPGGVVGLAIFGSYVSSISFLANPGKSFGGNWNPFVFALSLPLATWISVRYFVPFYRKSGDISAYGHLERRFGPWARTYAVVCYLLTQMARMGTIVYLLALALAPLTGLPVAWIILLTGAVMTFYTLWGGIEAAIWTGAVQSVLLATGALVCLVTLLASMPEGPLQVFRIAAAHGKFGLGSFGPSLSEPTFWVVLVYGLVINLQNFGIDQSYVQRYITARSDRDAARSVWMGGLLYLPIAAAFFFIGTALYAFYTARPDLLPASLAGKPDATFPHFIATQLPRGMTGLVIAAIFAASMDSNLNSMATLTLCDLYKRYFRPNAGERESLRVLHLSVFLWGALGTGAGLAMMHAKSALDAWWEWAGIFGGGMLGLFLLGILSRRANNAVGALAGAAGVLVILWMTLSPRWNAVPPAWRSPFHSFLVIVFGTAAILLVGMALGGLVGGKTGTVRDER